MAAKPITNRAGRVMDPHLAKDPKAVAAFLAFNAPPRPSQYIPEALSGDLGGAIHDWNRLAINDARKNVALLLRVGLMWAAPLRSDLGRADV